MTIDLLTVEKGTELSRSMTEDFNSLTNLSRAVGFVEDVHKAAFSVLRDAYDQARGSTEHSDVVKVNSAAHALGRALGEWHAKALVPHSEGEQK